MPARYIEQIDGMEIGPGTGSCGTAAYCVKRVIVADVETDPLWDDFRELAREFGFRACWSEPILDSVGNVLGTFALYRGEPGHPGKAEIELIEMMVSLASIAFERKQAEERLHEINAALEMRVEERTRELQSSNAELDAFAYSVSHDLRAPLRAMSGFASALLSDHGDQLDMQGRAFAARITAAAERMDRNILDLLAYSRIGREEAHFTRIELSAVIDDCLASLETEIQNRHAEVTVTGPFPVLPSHYGTLEQIVSNLISNAIKFVSKGIRPRLHIRCETLDDHFVLWFEDNGIGVPQDCREQIFGIFERLHGIETYPGTGIGLAIVRRAAESLNGQVGLESSPTAGSRFSVKLPLRGVSAGQLKMKWETV